jgi:NitT/TauT family transport system substrate-binding protein/putative hydroxymethylpyrimidine transport system substrate-binding protein
MRTRSTLACALAVALLAGCGSDDGPGAPEPLALALDFQPNPAHAGIYAARREGLDRDNGIALRVRVPSSSTDSLKLLGTGKADAAIVDIHDLGLARQRGVDVVGIGALVQRPLAAVIAQPSVRRPRDLAGKRVGVTGVPSDEAVLRSTVEADGGEFDRVDPITIGFSAVPSLAAGKVDAVVTFWNAEGVALRDKGVKTREFRVDDFGAPRYPELVVATTRSNLDERRSRYRALVATLAAGTRAALADRAAAVADIARASEADPGLVRAQLAAIAPALRPPLRLNSAELRRWAAFDAKFGILRAPPDVGRAFVTP